MTRVSMASIKALVVGSFPEPLHRLGRIPRHAPAVKVHDPELELGFGVALLCKRMPLAQRRRVVAAHVGVPALLKVLAPCRGGKRQEQQYGKDVFHAQIGHLTGGGSAGSSAVAASGANSGAAAVDTSDMGHLVHATSILCVQTTVLHEEG